MPDFSNPFSGQAPERKLTLADLVRAIRLDLAAEEEAIHQYTAQADATDNALARKVLFDIANEERVHAGEFSRLIQLLTGDEDKWLLDGTKEVDDMAAELAGAETKTDGPAGESPTVGSLKK